MKKIFIITILYIFVSVLFTSLPQGVLADDPAGLITGESGIGIGVDPSAETSDAGSGTIPLPEKPSNLPTNISMKDTIEKAFNIIVSVGEVAFIIMLLVGGVMYIVSGGDEAKGEKSKKLILNAVVGIVVLLSAWAIATWVLQTLGAGGAKVGG